jgi:hypothetical protein
MYQRIKAEFKEMACEDERWMVLGFSSATAFCVNDVKYSGSSIIILVGAGNEINEIGMKYF